MLTGAAIESIDAMLRHAESAPPDCQCDLCKLSIPGVPHLRTILDQVPDGWFGASHDEVRMYYATRRYP